MFRPYILVLIVGVHVLILKIKGMEECLQNEGCEEIVGGYGHKRYNKTYYVVNESLNWETAYSRCRTNYQELNPDELNGNLLEHLTSKTMFLIKLELEEKYSISEVLLWTSYMVVPTNTSLLYSTATCDFLPSTYSTFLNKVSSVQKTDVGCVVLDTSVIRSVATEALLIRDCNEQHMYICESTTDLMWSSFENKNITLTESSEDLIVEEQTLKRGKCARRCSGNLYCFATAFTESDQTKEGKCVSYVRKAEGQILHNSAIFYITQSINEGIVYVKTQPRFQIILLDNLSDGNSTVILNHGCDTFGDGLLTDASTVISTIQTDNSLHGSEDATSLQCSCNQSQDKPKSLSTAELDASIQTMKMVLSVDKKTTSAYLNKLHCARDDRPSAKVLGIVGTMIVVVTLLIIISCDLPRVHRCLKHELTCKKQWEKM